MNIALSENRTTAISDQLIANGIKSSAVTTISYGERNPVAMDNTWSDRAINRRIEIINKEEL